MFPAVMSQHDDSASQTPIISLELGFAGLRQFERGFGCNLAEDGLFIPCDAPLAPSTIVRVRVVLASDVVLLEATGVVFWSRTAAEGDGPPGMAVRFVSMAAEFEHTVRELLDARHRRGQPILRLDRPQLWPDSSAAWESPDVGYTLAVHQPGEGSPAGVRQLQIFPDNEPPAPDAAQADGADNADDATWEVASMTPAAHQPAAREAGADGDPPRRARGGSEVPGIAFEVSLYRDDDSPDTTPRLDRGHAGPEVTFVTDDDDEDHVPGPAERARLFVARSWLRFVLVLAALLLLSWATRAVLTRLSSDRGADGTTSSPTLASAAVDGGPATGDGGGLAPTATAVAVAVRPPTATATVPVPPTATPRPTMTPMATAPPTNTPRPTATATPSPLASLAVRDVSWRRDGRRTTVAIRADRPVEPSAVTVAAMTGPPRVLIRVRGVSRAFSHTMIQVGTDEITSIRVGYHPKERPPTLHIVLDLADERATLESQHVDGELIELVIAR